MRSAHRLWGARTHGFPTARSLNAAARALLGEEGPCAARGRVFVHGASLGGMEVLESLHAAAALVVPCLTRDASCCGRNRL